MAAPPSSFLDANQCIMGSYDDANGRLRVDASVSAVIGDVVIDASESDIAIADQITGNLMKVNADGSIDVNAVLDAGSDSVTVFQGTNPWIVSGSITTSPDVNIHDSSGNNLSSTGTSLDVNITNFPATTAVTQSTTPWIVDGSGFVQPVSGTITALQGTTPWTVDGTVNAAQSGVWSVGRTWTLDSLTDSVEVTQGTSPWVISGAVTTSPDVNIHDSAGNTLSSTGTSLNTNITNIVPVSQSGVWTAGRTWNLSSGTDSVAVTQTTSPWVISGTVNASNFPLTVDTNFGTVGVNTIRTASEIGNATGAADFNAGITTAQTIRVVLPTDQTSIPAAQSGSWTVTANAGTNLNTSLLATTANQTNGSQKTQIVDGAGTVIGNATTLSGVNYLPVVTDSSGPVSPGTVAERSILIGAQYNSTPPTLTNTQQSALQADVNGNLKVSIGAATVNVVPIGTLATYSASAVGLAVATTPTDIFTITGSSTKTIKISRLVVSGTQTNSSQALFQLIKRSTVNSGGTSSTLTSVPHVSTDAAATATVRSYTANPTLGTTVGVVRAVIIPVSSANAASGGSSLSVIELTTPPQKPITLIGTSEVLALNMNGVTMAGSSLNVSIEYTEE